MKRTVTFLSWNRFIDDHAAASLTSAPLYDNGQFLRKTWRPSEKNFFYFTTRIFALAAGAAALKISGGSGAEKYPEAALRHRAEAGTGRRGGKAPEEAEVIHKQENGQTGF